MKLKVAVFFGGESVEHEVSIISAHQAIENLDQNKYEIIPIYISKNREFYTGEELLDLNNFADMNILMKKLTQITLVKRKNKVMIEPVNKGLFSKTINTIDVAMPVVHGTNGEDGSLQGYLEMLKLPYTGCTTIPAGVGQDKIFMKSILAYHHLPLVDWFWIYGHEIESKKDEILAKVHEIGYPVILKPACLGSSIGIETAYNDEEFIEAVEETSKYDFKVIIERLVKNFVEINCSVRGTCYKAQASVLEQVAKDESHDIMDFKDKYLGNGKAGSKSKSFSKIPNKTGSKGMASASRIVPAPISDEKTKEIQNMALEVFRVLQASGVCRIDFMIDKDSDKTYITEINTIPGSLAYYLWDNMNIGFSELLDGMIEDALDLDNHKSKMTFSFESNILQGFIKK